jgi:hypothetical protein
MCGECQSIFICSWVSRFEPDAFQGIGMIEIASEWRARNRERKVREEGLGFSSAQVSALNANRGHQAHFAARQRGDRISAPHVVSLLSASCA